MCTLRETVYPERQTVYKGKRSRHILNVWIIMANGINIFGFDISFFVPTKMMEKREVQLSIPTLRWNVCLCLRTFTILWGVRTAAGPAVREVKSSYRQERKQIWSGLTASVPMLCFIFDKNEMYYVFAVFWFSYFLYMSCRSTVVQCFTAVSQL